jgi:hypothetical protein
MERLRLASALLAASAPIAFAAVDPQMTPTPLRVTQAIDVHGEQTEPASVHGSVQSFAFQGPSRCDADGNLYLLPRPSETSGRSTNAVLRISAAGVKSEFDLPTALDLRTGETARINAMALDVEGAVYVLGVFGSDETRRSIISLDNQGHVRSKHVLDESTMAVDRFAVFRGGDFLLVGRHPSTSEPRIALAGVSRPLQQLSWPFTPSGHAPARIYVEPGSDGNVYVAQETGTRVYAISEAGEVSGHFELASSATERKHVPCLPISVWPSSRCCSHGQETGQQRLGQSMGRCARCVDRGASSDVWADHEDADLLSVPWHRGPVHDVERHWRKLATTPRIGSVSSTTPELRCAR